MRKAAMRKGQRGKGEGEDAERRREKVQEDKSDDARVVRKGRENNAKEREKEEEAD